MSEVNTRKNVEMCLKTPITIDDLCVVLEQLKEKGFGDFLIEIGPDGIFLNKVTYVEYDKIVRLV